MKISKEIEGTKLTVVIEGRLDTTTAPELERELVLDGISDLVIDFSKLLYLSSAGLRVLLSTHKKITGKGGKMIIKNANEMIMDVFEATGFSDILTVEND